MEWSDLRIFLAIARAGTLGGAARQLGQSQPTTRADLKATAVSVQQHAPPPCPASEHLRSRSASERPD